jgi:nitrous oxide reductase
MTRLAPRLLLVFSALALAGLAALCGPALGARAAPPVQHVTIHLVPSVDGREVVPEPSFAIMPGAPVTVTFLNTSREFHTFTVPRLGVNVLIRPGSPGHPRATSVTFTAQSFGVFRWYCEFCPAVHHEGAMTGKVYAIVAG